MHLNLAQSALAGSHKVSSSKKEAHKKWKRLLDQVMKFDREVDKVMPLSFE